jgi:hypothetical protein
MVGVGVGVGTAEGDAAGLGLALGLGLGSGVGVMTSATPATGWAALPALVPSSAATSTAPAAPAMRRSGRVSTSIVSVSRGVAVGETGQKATGALR